MLTVSFVRCSQIQSQTWELVELSSEEYPTEHGRFWCWRLWTFEVDVLRLVGCKGVACRAWDDSQNTQPRDLTWNILGSKSKGFGNKAGWWWIEPWIDRLIVALLPPPCTNTQ